jgi:hypothetical protein
MTTSQFTAPARFELEQRGADVTGTWTLTNAPITGRVALTVADGRATGSVSIETPSLLGAGCTAANSVTGTASPTAIALALPAFVIAERYPRVPLTVCAPLPFTSIAWSLTRQ